MTANGDGHISNPLSSRCLAQETRSQMRCREYEIVSPTRLVREAITAAVRDRLAKMVAWLQSHILYILRIQMTSGRYRYPDNV